MLILRERRSEERIGAWKEWRDREGEGEAPPSTGWERRRVWQFGRGPGVKADSSLLLRAAAAAAAAASCGPSLAVTHCATAAADSLWKLRLPPPPPPTSYHFPREFLSGWNRSGGGERGRGVFSFDLRRLFSSPYSSFLPPPPPPGDQKPPSPLFASQFLPPPSKISFGLTLTPLSLNGIVSSFLEDYQPIIPLAPNSPLLFDRVSLIASNFSPIPGPPSS